MSTGMCGSTCMSAGVQQNKILHSSCAINCTCARTLTFNQTLPHSIHKKFTQLKFREMLRFVQATTRNRLFIISETFDYTFLHA